MAIVFSSVATATFDDLAGGNYQRIFDFSNGAGVDSIWLGQVGTSNDIAFEVEQNGTSYRLTIANAIDEGVETTWAVEIDDSGAFQVVKDGTVIGTQNFSTDAIPNDVVRTQNLVGDSASSIDDPLIGSVASIDVDTTLTNGFDLEITATSNVLGAYDGTDNDEEINATAATVDIELSGAGGKDTISGGAGSDTIIGGTGDDLLSGGGGDDTFVLEEAAEGIGKLILDGSGQSTPEWDGTPDLINQSTATDQSPPKMLLLDDGRVLYVWHDEGAADNNPNMDVQGRIFNADGTPSTDQFQIGTWAIDGNNAYDIDTFDLVQADNGNVVVGYVRNSSESGGDEPVLSVINPSFDPGQGGFTVASNIEIQQTDPASSAESPPILTALSDGRVLAVWNNNALADDNVNMEVQGRIFNADGTSAGNQFTVSNTAIDGSHAYDVQQMDVVETADGNVWIGFVSNTAEAGTDSPIATIIDPSVTAGQPGFVVAQDVEIQQTDGASYESPPILTTLEDGRVLAVWNEYGSSSQSSAMTVEGRIFDSDGSNATDQFQIGTWSVDGYDSFPTDSIDVVQTADGNVVVGYVRGTVHIGADEPVMSIINPAITPGQPGFEVATDVEIQQFDVTIHESPPTLVALDGGYFVAAWVNNIAGGDGDVFYRVFDSDGNATTDQITLSSTAGTDVDNSSNFGVESVDVIATGPYSFVVSWVGGSDGSGTGVYSSGPISLPTEFGTGNDTIIGGGTDETAGDVIDASDLVDGIDITFTGTDNGEIDTADHTINFSEVEQFILTDANDTVDASANTTGITVQGNAGDDSIIGGSGADSILGGTGADNMSGGADRDTFIIEDGFGNDTIIGGETGDDKDTVDLSALTTGVSGVLTGLASGRLNAGSDTITFSEIEAITLTGHADVIATSTSSGMMTIEAGAGADTIKAAGFGTDIDGGIGDDSLTASHGQVTLTGGDGNDSLSFGFNGRGLMDGGDGNDLLLGYSRSDTILGGAGDDTLRTGGGGNDVLDGGTGADTFIVSEVGGTPGRSLGNATIDGGEADGAKDVVDFGNHGTGVTVTYTSDEAATFTDNTDTGQFTGIESVILTNHADSLQGGGTQAMEVDAGSGADTILGGYGSDTIYGGTGNDQIDGGDGADSVEGGAGNDTIRGETGNDSISGGTGDDSIEGGAGTDTILAGEGNDSADGGFDNDNIEGGAGADTISGGQGSDTLRGGDDDDSIDGGDDSDLLTGDAGDDTLAGSGGDDTLTGGDGDDVFTYAAGDGNDVITDFSTGNSGALGDGDTTNNDFIDLSAFYSNITELRDDFDDDGIFNHSNNGSADYTDNTSFSGGSVQMSNAASSSEFTADNTGVTCYTTGTLIATPKGDTPIERLRVGDMVNTADDGPEPIRWIGMRKLDHAALMRNQQMRPVLIETGVLGNTRPLLVSQQHGLMIGGNTLVRAKHLAHKMHGVRIIHGKRAVTYVHLMFDAHQIIFTDSTPSESFYPGPMSLQMLANDTCEELFALFPKLRQSTTRSDIVHVYGDTARPFMAKRAVNEGIAV